MSSFYPYVICVIDVLMYFYIIHNKDSLSTWNLCVEFPLENILFSASFYGRACKFSGCEVVKLTTR